MQKLLNSRGEGHPLWNTQAEPVDENIIIIGNLWTYVIICERVARFFWKIRHLFWLSLKTFYTQKIKNIFKYEGYIHLIIFIDILLLPSTKVVCVCLCLCVLHFSAALHTLKVQKSFFRSTSVNKYVWILNFFFSFFFVWSFMPKAKAWSGLRDATNVTNYLTM